MRKGLGIFLFFIFLSSNLFAVDRPCLNPISTVDWGFFFDKLDVELVPCACDEGIDTRLGFRMSLYEPIAFNEVVKEAHKYPCIDLRLMRTLKLSGSNYSIAEGNNGTVKKNSHYIKYPVFAVLDIIFDFLCISNGQFDIGVPSEFNPIQNDDRLANIIEPDRLLFNNPFAQLVCAYDCIQSSVYKPADALYWCAGCWGSFSNVVTNAYGRNPLTDAGFITIKQVDLMHNSLQLMKTAKADLDALVRIIGYPARDTTCQAMPFIRIIKTQYALNLAYPTAGDAFLLGEYPLSWTLFKHFPGAEDFIFSIFRKVDCCFGPYSF